MLRLPARLAHRYRVGPIVGHGAIAEVVRAHDEQTGEEVALKVLYPALRDSPIVVERFGREVQLMRRIRHPHVLEIFDVVDSDGFLFLVMAYHPGGDLADRLARTGALDPATVRTLALQLGGALDAAHRAGIVHRDVKPSNVLIGSGEGPDVRLCDFGLARSAEGSGLTTNAAIVGTPEYMAPETIAEGHADPRSDVYSLGVLLFEAATGTLPFVADSPYQLMRQQLHEAAPRARSRVPDLPVAMDAAINRALEKDPLDRFASGAELVAAFSEPVDPVAGAIAWPAPAPVSNRARCPRCAGWMVKAAAICADCGHQALVLERATDGVSLLVTGPGATGDKINAPQHVDLFGLLSELPPESVGQALSRRAAPRLPFFVARGITEASAERLIPRLNQIGLEAEITRGWAFKPKEMRKKVSLIGARIALAMGVTSLYQWPSLLPDRLLHIPGFPPWVDSLGMYVIVVAMPSVVALALARRLSRPLVLASADDRKPAARENETAGLSRLAAGLRRIRSRQDRRLLARVLERATHLQTAGETTAAAAAARASDLCEGLAKLEDSDEASAGAALSPAAAQTGLRWAERSRVLLRGEILRLSSHLETLATARLRVTGNEIKGHAAELSAAAAALSESIEAESEVEALLRGGAPKELA